jgi:hypothetical protein
LREQNPEIIGARVGERGDYIGVKSIHLTEFDDKFNPNLKIEKPVKVVFATDQIEKVSQFQVSFFEGLRLQELKDVAQEYLKANGSIDKCLTHEALTKALPELKKKIPTNHRFFYHFYAKNIGTETIKADPTQEDIDGALIELICMFAWEDERPLKMSFGGPNLDP